MATSEAAQVDAPDSTGSPPDVDFVTFVGVTMTRKEWRSRQYTKPEPRTDREFECGECEARCTRSTDSQREYGHDRSCSRWRTGITKRTGPGGTPTHGD